MILYKFYEKGRFIVMYELANDEEAQNRAIELTTMLSFGIKKPDVTYKKVTQNETKK